MTGLYARSHGLFDLGYVLPEEHTCLSHILSEAGYRTGLFGKAHFEALLSRSVENMDHSQPYYGFQDCHITEDFQIGEYLDWIRANHPEYVYAALENASESSRLKPLPDLGPGKLNAIYTSALPEHLHQEAWITSHTIEFMKKCTGVGKPFFAWCSFVGPHHPWNPPEPYDKMYDPDDMRVPPLDPGEEIPEDPYWHIPDMEEAEFRRMIAAYYGKISHIDKYVGDILHFLGDAGLLDSTIIIFNSDHGDYNGDRGLIRKGWRVYDGLLRTPLIIRMPGEQQSDKVAHGYTQDVDFMPTILDLLGLSIPDSAQGISYADVLQSDKTDTDRDRVFVEFMAQWRPFQRGDASVGIIRGNWKLLYYSHERKYYLTNQIDDPYEYDNLYYRPEYKAVVDDLKLELLEWTLETPWYVPVKPFSW